MLSLAASTRPVQAPLPFNGRGLRVVVDNSEDEEDRRLLGKALASLRERAGLTQEEAAERFGVDSGQAFAKYETGEIKTAIFRPAVQRRLAAAVDATLEELLMRAAALRVRAPTPTGAVSDSALGAAGRRAPDIVPLRGRVEPGAWTALDSLADVLAKPTAFVRDPRYPKADQYAREVQGDGMNLAGLLDGDQVHVVAAADISYWPTDDHLVEVERRRRAEDGIERERQIRVVQVRADGVLLWARSTNKRWADPMVAGVGDPQPDGQPRIIGLVVATMRKLA